MEMGSQRPYSHSGHNENPPGGLSREVTWSDLRWPYAENGMWGKACCQVVSPVEPVEPVEPVGFRDGLTQDPSGEWKTDGWLPEMLQRWSSPDLLTDWMWGVRVLFVSPPHLYVEALTPSTSELGDKISKGVINVKCEVRSLGWYLMQYDWCVYKK